MADFPEILSRSKGVGKILEEQTSPIFIDGRHIPKGTTECH